MHKKKVWLEDNSTRVTGGVTNMNKVTQTGDGGGRR